MFQGYVGDFFSEGSSKMAEKKHHFFGREIIAESAGARKGLQQDCQLVGLTQPDGHTFGQGLRPETRKGRKPIPKNNSNLKPENRPKPQKRKLMFQA